MAYPKQSEIEIPLLQAIVRCGGAAEPQKLYPIIAESFPELTTEEQQRRMESSPSTRKWHNLVQWTRQSLVLSGEIDGSTRGIWKITDLGCQRLDHIGKQSDSTNHSSIKPPEAQITLRDQVNQNREELKERILQELLNLEPQSFEKFCRVFLEQVGFEEVEITKRGADGGVDGWGNFRQGVVAIRSAFQAKRWRDIVGRPEIDKFRGAIQGDYDHGVFLTTGRFSKDAIESSVKKGAITILLLDGERIAQEMAERGIGVMKEPIFLLDIDPDFFDFE